MKCKYALIKYQSVKNKEIQYRIKKKKGKYMSKFEDQLARMQGLMNYGIVSESEDKKSIDMEHQAIGADGKSYAIIKENSKYVIKSTDADKANIVESYEYIDGWNHVSDHSYNSYSEASKQFDMKMSSLNEAYAKDIRKENLNSFVNESYMTEGTEGMLSEIARQRQIMHNAAIIMNEASEISMNNTGDPERESGNSGDTDAPFTQKAEASLDKDPKQASGKPETKGDPYGDSAKAEKGKDAEGPEGCVACQHPKGGKVVKVNEDTMPSGEITDEGLPSQPGTGSPDGHLMEDEDIALTDDEPIDTEEEIDADPDDEFETEDEIDGDSELEDSEDFGGEEDFEDEDLGDDSDEFDDDELEDEEPEDDIDSLRAEIEELQARLDALEGAESGEDDFEPEDEEGIDSDEELGDDTLEDSEEFDEELGDEELEDEPIESEEEMEEEEFDPESMIESVVKNVSSKIINESKKKVYMESIVNSVVGEILSENKKRTVKEEKTELHDFGKHPGYRKKPMQLPETGSDEFQGNRDWNDESVHTEQPFGQSKGDSKPYKEIQKVVDSITEEVMQAIKKKA